MEGKWRTLWYWHEALHSTGTSFCLRLRLKRCCRIPHRTLALIASGPAALSWLSLSSCLSTWLLETDWQCEREREREWGRKRSWEGERGRERRREKEIEIGRGKAKIKDSESERGQS